MTRLVPAALLSLTLLACQPAGWSGFYGAKASASWSGSSCPLLTPGHAFVVKLVETNANVKTHLLYGSCDQGFAEFDPQNRAQVSLAPQGCVDYARDYPMSKATAAWNAGQLTLSADLESVHFDATYTLVEEDVSGARTPTCQGHLVADLPNLHWDEPNSKQAQ